MNTNTDTSSRFNISVILFFLPGRSHVADVLGCEQTTNMWNVLEMFCGMFWNYYVSDGTEY